MIWLCWGSAWLCAGFCAWFSYAWSPARACELALVLAVDVSGSVDAKEYRQQMGGLAAALRTPDIAQALLEQEARLSLVQWTGLSRQALVLPWVAITSPAELEKFAAQVADAPRRWRHYSTAIGAALGFAVPLFGLVPECRRRVIDVSGDGRSNEGAAPSALRAGLSRAAVTVNGLAIEESEADLAGYYFEEVIWGAGAFVEIATGFADYPDAIRRKLRREVVRDLAGGQSAGAGRILCRDDDCQ